MIVISLGRLLRGFQTLRLVVLGLRVLVVQRVVAVVPVARAVKVPDHQPQQQRNDREKDAVHGDAKGSNHASTT